MLVIAKSLLLQRDEWGAKARVESMEGGAQKLQAGEQERETCDRSEKSEAGEREEMCNESDEMKRLGDSR